MLIQASPLPAFLYSYFCKIQAEVTVTAKCITATPVRVKTLCHRESAKAVKFLERLIHVSIDGTSLLCTFLYQ